jgi:hypothetical protein
MFSSVPFSLLAVALVKRIARSCGSVAVLKRIVESRLEVSGVPLSFKNGQALRNPHAREDGQQVMSNDSQEKRPQRQIVPFWGDVLSKPKLMCNEWNKRLFYRKNQ